MFTVDNTLGEAIDIVGQTENQECLVHVTEVVGHRVAAHLVTRRFKDIGQIYDSYKRSGKVLFFNTEHLDRDGFVDEIEERLGEVARSMSDDYCKDYRTALETMLAQIKSQYQMNLDDYSLNMKALKENKAAMERLGGKLVDAANELRSRQDDLNQMIWRGIEDAEH